MLQVDVTFWSFSGWSDIHCFTTMEKQWRIIDGVCFISKSQFLQLKKAKQNRVRLRKDGFFEIYLLKPPKSYVSILQKALSTIVVVILWPWNKASEYKVHNIVTMLLYLSHFQKNNCWRSKIKCNIFALWFKHLRKNHYHQITRNQIPKAMVKEDHTYNNRKQCSTSIPK